MVELFDIKKNFDIVVLLFGLFMSNISSPSSIAYIVIIISISFIKYMLTNLFYPKDTTNSCGNNLSPFIFSFSLAYSFLPMFLFNDVNI